MPTEVAEAPAMMPYQVFAEFPFCAWKMTGLAAVPVTLSVPLMVISTRAVSMPEACPSVLASCTTVPAWMVRNAPAGTVMSPWTMYGLFAGVHVWLMMFPPTMVVACPVRGGVVTSSAAANARANRKNRLLRAFKARPPEDELGGMRTGPRRASSAVQECDATGAPRRTALAQLPAGTTAGTSAPTFASPAPADTAGTDTDAKLGNTKALKAAFTVAIGVARAGGPRNADADPR